MPPRASVFTTLFSVYSVASSDSEMAAIHYLAAYYAFLIVMGTITNSLIIIATIRTKSLHSTCNILIAFCATSDIMHQLGHLPKIIPIFKGSVEISSLECSISQIIPNFGLSAGVILVFLISIDRLLSVLCSPSFVVNNSRRILMCHMSAILAYAAIQYAFAYIYFEKRNVICSPPEIYHGRGKELWGIASLSVIMLSISVYYIVWRALRHSGVRADLKRTRRVFRSVFAVMCTLILGWLLTMTIIVIDRFVLDLKGRSMYIGEEVAGIPANTALTLNCFVLYSTSFEYRTAFRRLLRSYLASYYSFLIIMGTASNSLIIIATLRTKSLHSTCNILIAFCASSDIMHQLGHLPKIITIFAGTIEISSLSCCIAQIIPNFGLSAGVILVFLIAIDRLLSVHFSRSFVESNSRLILSCHTLAILAYSAIQYAFVYVYFEESPPEIYHGRGKELWGITSLSVTMLSILVYYEVWRELSNSGLRADLKHARRVFRSVFAVMYTLILGWLLSMVIIVIDRFVLDLNVWQPPLKWKIDVFGRSMYIGEEVAGIPANTALTLNCFVLYSTSVEYRTAFRRQLRAIPLIGRIFTQTKITTLNLEMEFRKRAATR